MAAIEAPTQSPRLLFVVTEDWYFVSHRLPVARKARDMGFEVVVATRIGQHRDAIEAEGFRVVPLRMARRGASLWGEIVAFCDLVKLYRRERPMILHHIAMKPILMGSVAAFVARVPSVVNTFAGLGFLFSTAWAARLVKPGVVLALRLFAAKAHTIVQNEDDRRRLLDLGVAHPDRTHLIRGSGVDAVRFSPHPEPDGPITAAFISRMLWDKGVGTVVEAARILRDRGEVVRFQLVGAPDPANPRSVPETTLKQWSEEEGVDWQGRREDIDMVWRTAHLAVMPTYYPEGLPKSLLEAAASGRALIASDVPGCRDIVRHGETGLLVPAQDPVALADALELLAQNTKLRRRLGKAARAAVEDRFADTIVAEQTAVVYRTFLTS